MTSSPESSKSNEMDLKSSSTEEENQTDLSSTSATTPDIPSFGWSEYAERVNGRFAMIGFSAILIIEAISHSGFLHWAGLVP